MPRIARIIAIGYPHHITQRGNYKQTVFTNPAEYSLYLKWLNEYAKKNGLVILAYCLMPNHVHFVAIPQKEFSMARTFNTCHMRYSQYFNKKKRLTGHLWQGRFFSCVLDEKYLNAAVRYVENNPVRARIVKCPEEWKWSSARAHLGKTTNSILELDDAKKYMDVGDWRKYLSQREEALITAKLKTNTSSGKPLGSSTFIAKMEEFLGRRIRPLPRGRPKKEQK